MGYLIIVALIQAFSFNLIGIYLAGNVDSYFAVLARVVLALLVFLPLTRWRQVEPRFMRSMLLIGALQYGITYVCLYLSFRVLTVPEVLLFTILTPLHVTLIEDALNRRFNFWALLAALVAVAGAAVIRFDSISGDFFMGFLLLQLANFTYAAGQVMYRHLVARHPSDLPHYRRFGYFYLGALIVVLPAFLLFGNSQHLPATDTQWLVLLFLGLVPTALGLYWWNKGACLVPGATLAVMNNLHVPVGLLLNLLIWNQDEPLGRLFVGGAIIVASVWMSRLGVQRPATPQAMSR
ncbi:carboxylate/amino acid/amine transporter [Pseudomonas sp. p1(2021b)]|uniref:carboxylate/amino acid/amine transporter n=1 Tax=Pseudomonas sp. p1(2021b) TaxID=2874628 RepID=UPI001CCF44CC|nr:carboxylate/amino acid/amine transporter [Pseudomonas sp. p1(2021b)]UBM24052.1 carboxylate/amino acid/amine transporter [Pseudomonas sp. p1(2021b)]